MADNPTGGGRQAVAVPQYLILVQLYQLFNDFTPEERMRRKGTSEWVDGGTATDNWRATCSANPSQGRQFYVTSSSDNPSNYVLLPVVVSSTR